MRTVLSFVVVSTMVCSLAAQVPVKKDLMQMLGNIPPPPATIKDAFTKIAAKDNSGTVPCSADNLFQSIDREVREIEAEFAAQPKPDPGSAVPGLAPEDAKRMNDPETKKKMKKMSKEEKMKMAMEMMKSIPPGGPVIAMDPPPVRAALDEWQPIYNDIQNEFQRSVAEQQSETRLVEEYKKSHAEVDAWETAEIGKLPQISSGEMSAPDPVKVKEVKLKSSDKHIHIAAKRLDAIRSQWRVSVDRVKAKYTTFYKKLIAAHYAAESKNFSTKKILADAQIMILENIVRHIKQSRSAWEESASWQALRFNIANQ